MKMIKKDRRHFIKMDWRELLSLAYGWIHLGYTDYGLKILNSKQEKPPEEYITDYYELKVQASLIALEQTDNPMYADIATKYLFSIKHYDSNHKYLNGNLLERLKSISENCL